jgi:hypothetical protein
MILSENRHPARIESGQAFFGIMRWATHEEAAPFSRRPTSPYIFVQDPSAINSRVSANTVRS